MDFILPVRSYNNTDIPIGLLDLKDIVIAVGISFLSCLQAEVEVFPVLQVAILAFLLSVKSHNNLGSSIVQVDPKHQFSFLKFRFYVAYKLRYIMS